MRESSHPVTFIRIFKYLKTLFTEPRLNHWLNQSINQSIHLNNKQIIIPEFKCKMQKSGRHCRMNFEKENQTHFHILVDLTGGTSLYCN